jgi:hypothetical protein
MGREEDASLLFYHPHSACRRYCHSGKCVRAGGNSLANAFFPAVKNTVCTTDAFGILPCIHVLQVGPLESGCSRNLFGMSQNNKSVTTTYGILPYIHVGPTLGLLESGSCCSRNLFRNVSQNNKSATSYRMPGLFATTTPFILGGYS